MIDLDKYDSEESQSSYRAKNSKELKHLKGELKRLRAENASLKSACKLAEKEKSDSIDNEDDKSVKLFFLFMLIMFFSAYTSFRLAEKAEVYESKYQQCLLKNYPVLETIAIDSGALNPYEKGASINDGSTLNNLAEIAKQQRIEKHKTLIEYDPSSQIFQFIVVAFYEGISRDLSNIMKPEPSK